MRVYEVVSAFEHVLRHAVGGVFEAEHGAVALDVTGRIEWGGDQDEAAGEMAARTCYLVPSKAPVWVGALVGRLLVLVGLVTP